MDRSDVAEAITVAALRRAGYAIASWDEPCDGFFVDPDIVATRDGEFFLVLVNASDSFFASQKKIWRNIEEPFEAQVAIGSTVRAVSVAFVSPTAKNALFAVASQLFDAQYLVCDEVDSWDSLLQVINQPNNPLWRTTDKRELALALSANRGHGPVADVLGSLEVFFARVPGPRKELLDLWKLEKERVKTARANQQGIRYVSGHYERRGIELCSLFGRANLDLWHQAGLSAGPSATFVPAALGPVVWAEVLRTTKALEVHGLSSPMTFAITGKAHVSGVADSIVAAFKTFGPVRIREALDALYSCHPPLRDFVLAARDFEKASLMAGVFLGAVKAGSQSLKAALRACSESGAYAGIASDRNWMLDLLLYASSRSQTDVQRHCSIGRLTHAATGQLRLTVTTAGEIVDYCSQFIDTKLGVIDLAKMLMHERLYSLQTHSYANPLYCTVSDMLRRRASQDPARYSVTGFPETNSVSVLSWHNRGHGAAGEIKVQFVVADARSGRELVIRVGSCHDGNVGNKRKEVAAKGRVLSYHWPDGGAPELAHDRRLVLILDGEWEAAQEDPLRHVRMMHEAGWGDVLSPSSLDALIDIWNGHFGEPGV